MNDEDEDMLVFTHQTKKYNELVKNPLFECLNRGQEGNTKWGEFRGPAWAYSFRSKKRTNRSAE